MTYEPVIPLPCPFCGSSDIYAKEVDVFLNVVKCRGYCRKCTASSGDVHQEILKPYSLDHWVRKCKKRAIEAWNIRVKS